MLNCIRQKQKQKIHGSIDAEHLTVGLNSISIYRIQTHILQKPFKLHTHTHMRVIILYLVCEVSKS